MSSPDIALHKSLDGLLAALPMAQSEVIRLGAIPHWLDADLAGVLFPEAASERLADLSQFSFVGRYPPGQLTYNVQVRAYLLHLWRQEDPVHFREVSAALAEHFLKRSYGDGAVSETPALEWAYHSLGADPEVGIRYTAQLFERALDVRELSLAEFLSDHAEEQAEWLGEPQLPWLQYFRSRLALARYDDRDTDKLDALAQAYGGTTLGASAARASGQVNSRRRQWARARGDLLIALQTFEKLRDPVNSALSHLALGELYRNLAESSGGILDDRRQFIGPFHAWLYYLSRGPLVLYRNLSARVEFLPSVSGTGYQNWVVQRLLRLALSSYRRAAKIFAKLKDESGAFAAGVGLAGALLSLGYPRTAGRLLARTLRNPVVLASPHRTARVRLGSGLVAAQLGKLNRARYQLGASLNVFELTQDWSLAAQAAISLGSVYESRGDFRQAVSVYAHGLTAIRNSPNPDLIMQTEIARRLGVIADSRETASQADIAAAQSLQKAVTETAYIARFPGLAQHIFRWLTLLIAVPFLVATGLALVAGAFISMQILEGELFLNLAPVGLGDALQLLGGVLLPLVVLWTYRLVYLLVAKLVIFVISFAAKTFDLLEATQPDQYELSPEGILHRGGQGEEVSLLRWDEVEKYVVSNRRLYDAPLAFFSSLRLLGHEKVIECPGITYRYRELQSEIEVWLGQQARPPRQVKSDISILRTRGLLVALGIGLLLAAILDLMAKLSRKDWLHGCYTSTSTQKLVECPQENRLYLTALLLTALVIATIVFVAITELRWWRENRKVAQALTTGTVVDLSLSKGGRNG